MASRIKKILVTAGPTREKIDPVRFISNLSTGEMGYAIAQAAARKKYQVTLVSGPTSLKPPQGVRFFPVGTAREMKAVCTKLFPKQDCLIMAAAVCDFAPVRSSRHKIPSHAGYTVCLKRTPDILAALAKRKGRRTVIGFCLETRELIRRAEAKLREKHLDGIVANYYDPRRHVPFGDRRVDIVLIDACSGIRKYQGQSKKQFAKKLLAWMEGLGGHK